MSPQWLWDDNTHVITLADNIAGNDSGLHTWILSYLTYPLAWVFDTYRVCEVDAAADITRTFLRTAGLFYLYVKADRIFFVIPTKTKNNIDIGRRSFPVATTNHKVEYDRNNPVQLYDMDEIIRKIVHDTLMSRDNLKRAFQAHTKPSFDSRLNWLEICSPSNSSNSAIEPEDRDSDTQHMGQPLQHGGAANDTVLCS